MGTLDNIYVLNYLINRQVRKKENKMVVLFVDLKAAFDSVNRGVLLKALRERGVRERLVKRCEEIVRETVSRVRIGKREGEKFYGKGSEAGMPVEPFAVYSDISGYRRGIKKGKMGRGGFGEG